MNGIRSHWWTGRSRIRLQLTAAEFNVTSLVVHRIAIELHATEQRHGQPLAEEDLSIWRETQKAVGNGQGVKNAWFEIPDEDVGRPQSVVIAVAQSYAENIHSTEFIR